MYVYKMCLRPQLQKTGAAVSGSVGVQHGVQLYVCAYESMYLLSISTSAHVFPWMCSNVFWRQKLSESPESAVPWSGSELRTGLCSVLEAYKGSAECAKQDWR